MLAFTQGIGAATHAMRLLNTVVKTNTFGPILSVIAPVVIDIKSLIHRNSEYTKKMREARNTAAARIAAKERSIQTARENADEVH